VAGTLLGFPLDAIKTRMQAQSAHPISAAVEHLSGVSIVRKMWHEDGVRCEHCNSLFWLIQRITFDN
jgi:hypothetical protein